MPETSEREFMLDIDQWKGPFICLKNKAFNYQENDLNKNLGVLLAVKDKEKGEVAVLLHFNIYSELEEGRKAETINVDDLIAQGWVVD